MHILAFYRETTLSIVRRVMSPFSVLTDRGHSFSFLAHPTFDSSIVHGYHACVLPNIIFDDSEYESYQKAVDQNQLFIYDLSEPLLLESERVVETLRLATAITVPNAYLASEVKYAAPGSRVHVLPTPVHIPYMMQGNRGAAPQFRYIACFGPHAWHLVRAALEEITKIYAHIHILGDAHAREELGELVSPLEVLVDNWPLTVRHALMALLPQEGLSGEDTVWAYEYGILSRAIITTPASSYSRLLPKGAALYADDTSSWVRAIRTLIRDEKSRSELGNMLFREANLARSTKLADAWLDVYSHKILPHLP